MKIKIDFDRQMLFSVLLLVFCFAVRLPAQQLQLPAEMVVTNRFANIRKGPGTGYDKLTTLYKGDRLRAERKYTNWLRVLIPDGRIGWIREDLVGPFSVDDLPLTDEQADSLKNLVDKQKSEIDSLDALARQSQDDIAAQEQARDSLLNLVGLREMPTTEFPVGQDSVTGPDQPLHKLPGIQESILTQPVDYPRRFEFSPYFGVLAYDGDAMPLVGLGVARNFTRELAYRAQVSFSRLDPQVPGSLFGDLNRYFITGSLIYNYKPGRVAVPYAELGGGALHASAGDSSYTAFDLVFGAGTKLFLTPDLALKFGYQGHLAMVEDNQLMSLFHLGAAFHLPHFEDSFPLSGDRIIYLAPYFGYQMFSRRFALNSGPVAGMRAGCRLTGHLAAEIFGGYLPLKYNDGSSENSLGATQLSVQALYYFWETMSGPYLTAGFGSMSLGGEGRSTGNNRYGSYHLGGGFNFQCTPKVSLRSEVLQLIYPSVADFRAKGKVKSAGALQLSTGMNFNF